MWSRLIDIVSKGRKGQASRRRPPLRARPMVEGLEDRWCPAGTWEWNDPLGGNWSNAAGSLWVHNGALAPANDYPGMAGSTNDVVEFSSSNTGPCTLDVAPPNPIKSLEINGWNDTLTLNNPLTVTAGDFQLMDNSTISLTGSNTLTLDTLSQANSNLWEGGTITGGAGSKFIVKETVLDISQAPAGLGTNMVVTASGQVVLSGMTDNLTLTAAGNYIDVQGDRSSLSLNQVITANGQQNTEGGIAFGAGHAANAKAVQLELPVSNPPLLTRGGTPVPGVADQVMIAGAVYSFGGYITILQGTMLKITGVDGGNVGFWQKPDPNYAGSLFVDAGANLNAAGTYQIDGGNVYLQTGGASLDRLDGAGLIFGNANATYLIIDDNPTGGPGTVTVKGPVTLAAKTTTTMSFTGGSNQADLLDVQNGALTLNGKLSLHGIGGRMPTAPLNFFDDSGATPAITDLGIVITDDAGGKNDTGRVVTQNANLKYYQVTIK